MELFRPKIDEYFLDKRCSFTGRRSVHMKRLKWIGGLCLVIFISGSIYFGKSPDEESKAQAFKNNKTAQVGTLPDAHEDQQSGRSAARGDFHGLLPQIMHSLGSGSSGGGSAASSSRSHAANQVIRRGENGNDPLTRLPVGTTISAKLVNSIISTNTGSPVIAEIPQEILVHETSSIPEGAKAIGVATFDDSTRRIQVRFNTFVYPDGDQHSVQGMAMMADGSAGLEGDYHSETGKRELGNFLGNFVAGFANGMEDRTSGEGLGLPYEVGSLRDGALNGVSLSAQGEAKTFSDDLAKSKPYMTLSGGKPFLIYLDHEYMP